jgi:hypothetical protein
MTARRPLVTKDGFITELPAGDTVSAGFSSSNVVAGSGLIGGGGLHENPEIDIALPPNPSGLIFVGDALGNDGYAQATADAALASGIDAGTIADTQVVSGNAALFTGVSALGSGNAALEIIPNLVGGGPFDTFTAAGTILSGMPVGVDDTGRVQAVAVDQELNDEYVTSSGRLLQNTSVEFANNKPTYIGTHNGAAVVFQGQMRTSISQVNNYRIITISGTSEELITNRTSSFGNSYLYYFSSCYLPDSDQVFMLYYISSPQSLNGRAGQYNESNGLMSLGTASQVNSAAHNYPHCAAVSGTNEVHLIFTQSTSYPRYERWRVNSNNTITQLYQANLTSVASYFTDIAHNAHQGSSIAVWRGASNYLYASSLSGSTFTTPNVLSSVVSNQTTINYLDNVGKCVVTARQTANGSGVAFIAETSGSTVVRGPLFPLISGSETQNQFSSVVPLNDTANRCIAWVQGTFSDAPTTQPRTQLLEVSGMTILPVAGRSVISGMPMSSQYNYGSNGAFIPEINSPLFVARNATANITYAIGEGDAIEQDPIPTRSGLTNYMGISQETVSSGDSVLVALPGYMHVGEDGDFSAGSSYYLDPVNSGLTTVTPQPYYWNGEVAWNRVGQGVSSSGIMLLNSL